MLLKKLKPTCVYDTYWRFAAERQKVFFARMNSALGPWTEDTILKEYKFTNAYRVVDRVSQYLILNVIMKGDQSPNELFFRILLFKLFNKIETWQLLKKRIDNISYAEYRFNRYAHILDQAMRSGQRIYSAAYIMPAAKGVHSSPKKHETHLKLIEYMVKNDLPERIAECTTMKAAYQLLRSCPSLGNFLAYQLVTDLNYSNLTNFTEMEFVIPGPGALSGIQKCFEGASEYDQSDIIRFVAERQDEEFRKRGIRFQSLWGRPLQLIDCQNLFCETDKYARVKHPEFSANARKRIKQKFKPKPDGIDYVLPIKWNIETPKPRRLA